MQIKKRIKINPVLYKKPYLFGKISTTYFMPTGKTK